MGRNRKKTNRLFRKSCDLKSTLCLVLVVFAMLGMGAAGLFSCTQSKDSPYLKIGLPEEPRSLNLWLGTDANSRNILSQIYQPLFRRHPETLEMIPWLAKKDAEFDEEKLTYTVTLRDAKWSDGSDFTSEDVLFTRQLFADFKIPRYDSHWQVIEKAEALDDHTVVFHLKEPSAVFLPRVMTAPIVSKKEWEQVCKDALATEKPLRYLQDYQIENPLGTGPFMVQEYQKGAYIHMVRNPHFFGQGLTIGDMTLGPHVDHVLFNIYGTSDVAILALKKGDIDYYWWDIQPGYLKDLEKDSDIDLHYNKKSALYYLGFNLRKPPFNDKVLRQAIATVVDKTFILDRILQNHGNPMHSIVPAGNRFWHNPDVRKYGEGMDQETRIKAAFQMLSEAGYSWVTPPVASDGTLTKPSDILLPSGEKMEKFVILTPPADYDPKRAFAGTMIQEWLRQLGMPAFARPMAFNSLLETVKGKHDFDAFVLGYGKLDLDPDYLGSFFSSKNDNPRDWNMSGYRNPEFDKLAETQRLTVDLQARRQMIFQMQAMLLEDVPYYPLYNPHIIEATVNKRFTGWVNRVDGIGNIWSLCMVKPVK